MCTTLTIMTWEADGFRCAQLSGLGPRKELSQTETLYVQCALLDLCLARIIKLTRVN